MISKQQAGAAGVDWGLLEALTNTFYVSGCHSATSSNFHATGSCFGRCFSPPLLLVTQCPGNGQ
ncbi:hypothetical protein PILCRDRAFT_824306 [Piloderma croceum F 1598]|uniref:Uncharacterized protein n=1 Tax=Piloderma croceum (strain F 1598) TaxID=765440 RepID=A0A0C3FEV8_PILCF|nr:hypothetical protein PILCRDRAFT_824306 [Piloderma croceum F 1598]